MSNDIAILQSKQISLNAELSNLQSEIQMLNEKNKDSTRLKLNLPLKFKNSKDINELLINSILKIINGEDN